jgi:hypothetical protein
MWTVVAPKLLKPASVPAEVVAATEITFASE